MKKSIAALVIIDSAVSGSLPNHRQKKEVSLIVSIGALTSVTINWHVELHVSVLMFVKKYDRKVKHCIPHSRMLLQPGGEMDHVFVRKIHTWVIRALCASEAKHIRKQSCGCQASRNFQAEKYYEFTRKWEYTGWNEGTEHCRVHVHTFSSDTIKADHLHIYCCYTTINRTTRNWAPDCKDLKRPLFPFPCRHWKTQHFENGRAH